MTKIIRSGFLAAIFTLIVLTVFPTTAFAKYEARLTAPSGEPYYNRSLNAYSQTGYGMPNCVAYAYGRIYELNGTAPKISRGNAGDWWFINKGNNYYEYGNEPKLGAVACWSNHVAVVEGIGLNGEVTVSESHWGGTYFDTKVFANMNSHYGQAFYGYIYMYDNSNEEVVVSQLSKENAQSKPCFTALEDASSKNQSFSSIDSEALFAII